MHIKRIKELTRLGVLEKSDEEIFTDVAKTASQICDTPITLVVLLGEEKQWFKARVGTELKETPIAHAICTYTINEPDGALIVEDLRKDIRFKDNPFVKNEPFIKSYFGVSLETENNIRIGTVCVFDNKVRSFNQEQIICLSALAKYTVAIMQEKSIRQKIESQNLSLSKLYNNLESFSQLIAHDVKTPLKTIRSFVALILNDEENKISEDSTKFLAYLEKEAEKKEARD